MGIAVEIVGYHWYGRKPWNPKHKGSGKTHKKAGRK